MSALEIGGIPCSIREVFYAPPCPEEVAVLFEVALTHHNTSNYALAVETYLQAQQKWETELTGPYRPENGPTTCLLPTEAQVFIRLAVGSVFESAGQDQQALAEYLEAKRIATANMPGDHAVHGTIHSALGTVYCHLAQYDIAADHHLKALDQREKVIGTSHPDTALVLNNIGVCLHCVDRTADALEMYTRAEEILKALFALEHPRLVIVRRNIQRAKLCHLKNSTFEMPAFKPVKVPFAPGAMRSRQLMAKLEGKGKKK